MRLLKRFLRLVGSKYQPDRVYRINNKRFITEYIPVTEKEHLTYTGKYLGRDRRAFEPSSILLDQLGREEETRKVCVNRKIGWLFICGKDVFAENVINFEGGQELGKHYLVMFGEDCLGYGRYETSNDIQVIRNLFDIGDFLRRES